MGLVLFHPEPNHIEAQPNKMFEYMIAGLPVIASNFPLWRQLVEGAGCGLVVNPLSVSEIAQAMEWILDHPAEAAQMGERGREYVLRQANWAPEAQKLIALYQDLQSR
jgi:glycosyltransferase involved in cell wall biosynthesis